MKNLRALAIALLDDECGINETAYQALDALLVENGHKDISNLVRSAQGRYYLPENHSLTS